MIGQAAEYGCNILLRFTNARNAASRGDSSRARIISGQRLFDIAAESVQLFAQVTGAAFQIGIGIIGIDPELASGAGHQLGKPARPGGRNGIGPPAAFLPHQRFDQGWAEIIACGQFPDLGDIGGGNAPGSERGIGNGLGWYGNIAGQLDRGERGICGGRRRIGTAAGDPAVPTLTHF